MGRHRGELSPANKNGPGARLWRVQEYRAFLIGDTTRVHVEENRPIVSRGAFAFCFISYESFQHEMNGEFVSAAKGAGWEVAIW